MNKNVVLVFTTMALLLSCSREVDQVIQPGETITFTAGWAGAKDTRTILQPDGTSVWWEPSAQINVFFSDKASGKFTSTNSQAQGIVDFKGSLPIVVGSVETDNPAHAYWAVYPYDSANICDGESVTLTIPSTQTASEGTFANKMFPSIATSTNFYLAFYNICGGVRFTVANEGINSVTFKANNGESLVGKVQVGFDGVPVIKNVTAGSTEVTVNAPEGGFIPGKEYFASILPQTLSKGVSLTFKKANGTVASTSIDNAITVNRSRFGTMTEKDKSLVFQGEVPVSSIELSQTSVQIRAGESIMLDAAVMPEDATDKTVSWSSSNEEVVTVNNNGRVIALLEGNAIVSATAGDKTATCSVTVISANFHPNGEYLAFTGLTSNSSVFHTLNSYSNSSIILEYSFDTDEWYPWSEWISLSIGTKIYVRGCNWPEDAEFRFLIGGKVAASGNIMSLLYYDDFENRSSFDKEYSFIKSLFRENTSLVEAPDLPATTLFDGCYKEMFSGCKSLVKAPTLPATTLTKSCYEGMFSNCESLVQAPEISAINLDQRCFWGMFLHCTRLEKAPVALYAKTLARECCAYMFYGCTSLIQAPKILAESYAELSCSYMFFNCFSLTQAPEIIANTVDIMCCYNMFVGCEGLKYPPSSLPATSLAEGCYQAMFSGCTSLIQAPELPAVTLAPSCYSNMFLACKSLTQAPELPAMSMASYCYEKMFHGTGLTQAPKLPAMTLADRCYESMFSSCRYLTSAPELPAVTLADGCYSGMFRHCVGLTQVPNLSATTLANYSCSQMFEECTSLTQAPELPATSLAKSCYEGMFGNCTSLTQAPELPATSLAECCYHAMFNGCTSLIQAPELPATSLAKSCYEGMFGNCTSLTQAPELPAITLVNQCYSNMFNRCTSLTKAPELPATSLEMGCYNSMFRYCDQLTDAPDLPATTLADECYYAMFESCKSLTIAPVLPALSLANYCYFRMFHDCISLTQAPELPATSLKEQCYSEMFKNCSSLKSAPELPAITVTTKSYNRMFENCNQLEYVKMMAKNITNTDCFAYWLLGVARGGTFVKNAAAAWNESAIIPSSWTVITATE